MRLLILSDLHREIYPDRDLKIDLEVSKPDVVILAGDIDKGAKAIQWAADTFAGLPVLYVAGNHEAYGLELDVLDAAIHTACDFAPNVQYLDAREVIIDNVRFIGATLWTDFALYGDETRNSSMELARNKMNDYHRIRLAGKGYRKLSPTDTLAIHKKHRKVIERALLINPPHGKTVVITHMLPSLLSIPDQYAGYEMNPAYASNLDVLAGAADVWIHGHTHDSMDYQIGKCRVVCNPCGYQLRSGGNENPNFNPNFIVEI